MALEIKRRWTQLALPLDILVLVDTHPETRASQELPKRERSGSQAGIRRASPKGKKNSRPIIQATVKKSKHNNARTAPKGGAKMHRCIPNNKNYTKCQALY